MQNLLDTPILIVVTSTRWDAIGDPSNPHHKLLYKALSEMGGINESVQPGEYHFDIKTSGGVKIAELNPVPN